MHLPSLFLRRNLFQNKRNACLFTPASAVRTFSHLCVLSFVRDECKSQVEKFPAASFKKFASERDAWAFVRGAGPSAAPGTDNGAETVEPGVSLLPKRGPEALEYIPLGKKRSHSSDHQEEAHAKKLKLSGASSSERSDGFTYMGKMEVVACRAVFRGCEPSVCVCVCRRRCGRLHRWLLLC